MLTLLEANKYNQGYLQRGVVEQFARSNAILELLPFRTIQGNSYSYVREETLPDVEWRAINDGYQESTGTVSRATETLAIFGGDAVVDKFLESTSDLSSLRAFQLEMKVKQMAKTFASTFMNGNATENPNMFNGLNQRIDPTQVIPANGTELSLGAMHELLDAVDGGADVIITTKAGKRDLQKIYDLHPTYIQTSIDSFGRTISLFNDVRVITLADDVIPFRPAEGAGEVSDIFAVRFGEDGLSGLQNGNGIQVTDIGELPTKPSYLSRIEWYCTIMLQNPKAVAKLEGFLRAS